jgi:predicted nucleic acid-binding protein
VKETSHRLRLLERYITVLREPMSAYGNWKRLVVAQSILGKQVHDARLAALMGSYRIKRILTMNSADFLRYRAIEPITPQEILAR